MVEMVLPVHSSGDEKVVSKYKRPASPFNEIAHGDQVQVSLGKRALDRLSRESCRQSECDLARARRCTSHGLGSYKVPRYRYSTYSDIGKGGDCGNKDVARVTFPQALIDESYQAYSLC